MHLPLSKDRNSLVAPVDICGRCKFKLGEMEYPILGNGAQSSVFAPEII